MISLSRVSEECDVSTLAIPEFDPAVVYLRHIFIRCKHSRGGTSSTMKPEIKI
jgi:hypothetical protein